MAAAAPPTRKRKREAEPLRNDVFRAVTAVGMQRADAVGGAIHRLKEAVAGADVKDTAVAVEAFVKCVVGVPQRATAYAAAVRVLGDVAPDAATRVVDGVVTRLNEALSIVDWHGIKTCFRFLGYLEGIGVVAEVTPAVARLLQLAVEEKTPAGGPAAAARADGIVHTVMSCIPWLPDTAVASSLLPLLRTYFADVRVRSQSLLPRRAVHVQQYNFIQDPKSAVPAEPDLLEVMWEEITAIYAAPAGPNGPRARTDVLTDYIGVYKGYLRATGAAGRNKIEWQHPAGALDARIGTLRAHAAGARGADLPSALQLFAVRDGQGKLVRREMQAVSEREYTFGQEDELWFDEIEAAPFMKRLVIRELTFDVMHCFHADRGLVVTALAELGRGAAASACVVDAVFSAALTLPAAPLPQAFYTTLLNTLCKEPTSPYALPVVAAFDTLLSQVASLDPELNMRLLALFAAHLANHNFKWTWAQTDKHADLQSLTAQKLFNFELMHQCTRTAPKAQLAASDVAQIDKGKVKVLQDDGVIRYKFKDPGLPFKREADCLLIRLSEECSVEEVLATLERMAHNGTAATDTDRAEVLVNCLLFLGSDSVAHETFLFRRYAPALKLCQGGEGKGLPIITAASDFWDSNPHHCVMTMSILIQLAIVTPQDVVAWVLTEDVASMYERSFLWEIVYMMFDHLTQRVRRAFEELVDLEGALLELEGMDTPDAVKATARKQVKKKITKLQTAVASTYLVELRSGMRSLFAGLVRRIRVHYKREKAVTMELLASDDEARRRQVVSKNFVWCRGALGHLNAVGRRYLPYLLPFVDELYEDVFGKAKVPAVVRNIFFSWQHARGRRTAPDIGGCALWDDTDALSREVLRRITTTGVGGAAVPATLFDRLDSGEVDVAGLLPKDDSAAAESSTEDEGSDEESGEGGSDEEGGAMDVEE